MDMYFFCGQINKRHCMAKRSKAQNKQYVPQVHFAWNSIPQIQQSQNRIRAARNQKYSIAHKLASKNA